MYVFGLSYKEALMITEAQAERLLRENEEDRFREKELLAALIANNVGRLFGGGKKVQYQRPSATKGRFKKLSSKQTPLSMGALSNLEDTLRGRVVQ